MNKGSIVERLCSDLDRKEPRYKCATLLYFSLRPLAVFLWLFLCNIKSNRAQHLFSDDQ